MRILGMAAVAGVLLAAGPSLADDQIVDLSAATCQDYIDGGKDGIQMIGTWLDAYYYGKGKPVINATRLIANMQALGKACSDGKRPLMQAADEVYKK